MKEKIKNFFKENWKFLVSLVIIFLVFRIELPYKVYTPGGLVDLANRVSVESGYDYDGTLGMSYVSVVRGSIPFLLLSYIIPDWDIVSTSELTYDNETYEESFLVDQIATEQSVDSAIIASYTYAGKEIEVTKEVVHVTYIDTNAKTELKLLDIILSVEGVSISSTSELIDIVSNYNEGDTITMVVLRDDEEIEVSSTIYLIDGEPKVGISLTVTYEYTNNPDVNVETKSTEAGSSGGLMIALAIYNSLVEEDITKGKTIVGTGTIDIYGNVGEIGGVRYKLIGAVKNGADVFLVPEGNYEEAMSVKEEKGYDITIISVSTLEGAIEALYNLE